MKEGSSASAVCEALASIERRRVLEEECNILECEAEWKEKARLFPHSGLAHRMAARYATLAHEIREKDKRNGS